MSKGLPFFRCTLCMGIISMWDIYQGDHQCPKCGGARMSPTNLTFWEKLVQICKHPKLWTWHEEYFHA